MKKNKIISSITLLLCVALGVAVWLNWRLIYDWYLGLGYEPTSEMIEIKNKLDLTTRGDFLFTASRAELNTSAEFNQNCHKEESEIAVLGCYTDDTIYIHHIKDESLNGILETTTAHELLHAVFARMGDGDKENLKPTLQKVLQNNPDLSDELASYGEEDKFEELYVRAGTEIKNLPENLENYYAEIFNDREKIVNFYENYIKVFRSLKTELETLQKELEPLREKLDREMTQYEKDLAQLNADIVSFNACVDVNGCFKNNREFYTRRNALITTQKNLNIKYDELNIMIEDYNKKVEQYNNDVLRGQELNRIINSNARPSEIK